MQNHCSRKIIIICVLLSVFGHVHAKDMTWEYYYKDGGNAKSKRIALVVGVNQFTHDYWSTLKYAGKDAADVSRALLSSDSSFDTVIVLNEPGNTTKATILKKLDELIFENTSRDDTVVVYFSTHGTIYEDKGENEFEQYLVAGDTDPNNIKYTGISLSFIREKFSLLKSKQKALIIATCYSGYGKSKFSDETRGKIAGLKGPPVFIPLEEVSESSIILSASRALEPAREDDELQNDIYTYFFIKALKEKELSDKNKDGAVSILEAHDVARSMTYHFTQGKQVPTAEVKLSGADMLLLSGKKKKSEMALLFEYSGRFNQYAVLVDGQKKGELPGSVSIKAGDHQIEILSDDQKSLYKDEITFSEDSQLNILDLIATEPNHLGFYGAVAYSMDSEWKSRVGDEMLYGTGFFYKREIMTHAPFLIALQVDVSYMTSMSSSLGSSASAFFRKADYNLSSHLTLLKNQIIDSHMFLGVGVSDTRYSVTTDGVVETNTGFKPNVFGGTDVNVHIVGGLYAFLKASAEYTPLSFDLAPDIDFVAISLAVGLEGRF